jgi:soluble cytochrome b562
MKSSLSGSKFSPPIASVLIAALLGGFLSAHAQDKPKSPLAQEMSGISKDFRSLRKVVNDPSQKDAALGLVKDMEARATKAKGFEPEKTADIAPADRPQFLIDYRKQMDGLIADFGKLEQAVSDGKTADASALLDKLQADKREGHKKFNAEDDNNAHPWSGAPGGNPPPAPAAGQAPPSAVQSGTN